MTRNGIITVMETSAVNKGVYLWLKNNYGLFFIVSNMQCRYNAYLVTGSEVWLSVLGGNTVA